MKEQTKNLTSIEVFNELVSENSIALSVVSAMVLCIGIIYDVHYASALGMVFLSWFTFQVGHRFGKRQVMDQIIKQLLSLEDKHEDMQTEGED